MATHDFKDLIVWKRSMDLVVDVYAVVKKLPNEETYALGDQIRRCAVSVPANIAEDQKRNHKKEFIQFCSISRGSLAELETHLLLAERIYKLQVKEVINEIDEVGKMISGLINSIK
jgi:four helix bundle protein